MDKDVRDIIKRMNEEGGYPYWYFIGCLAIMEQLEEPFSLPILLVRLKRLDSNCKSYGFRVPAKTFH